MNKKLKIYLIAGEPSGDALGARLMSALKKKTSGKVEFFGLGGENMENEGLTSLFDISELSIMGLAEIVPSIPKILRRIKQTVSNILQTQPDIVISIDSWSFASRVQKLLRSKKVQIPQVHYVAPQVWAWKKKRAKTMHKYVDCLLTLLPYEAKYFVPHGLKTVFVGHPVIESPVAQGDKLSFRKQYNIDDNKKIVCILPGSRHNEVATLLPIFLKSAKKLHENHPELLFVIPTVRTVEKRVKKMTANCGLPILLVESSKDRHNAMRAAETAIAASGTVALELAIANVPHIIGYKVSLLTAFIVEHLMHIKFVNLSNILLNRELVPELLQKDCNTENIVKYTELFLQKGDFYQQQLAGFAEVRKALGFGEQTPSEKAADTILGMIKA